MLYPLVVSDLDFLTKVSLNGPFVFGRRRVAYFAGLLSVFKLACLFNEKKVLNVRSDVYESLSGNLKPKPEQPVDFAKIISTGTDPSVNISLDIFVDFGYSYNAPGEYYYSGMKNGVLVAMIQVPSNFIYLDLNNWRDSYKSWLDQKIQNISTDYEMEKSLMKS